jgi:hypothetical protein
VLSILHSSFFIPLIQPQSFYNPALGQMFVYDVGGIFGLYVAVHDAPRVNDERRAGALLAVLAEVKAIAGLHPHFVLLAAHHYVFHALSLQLNFQGLRYFFANVSFLGVANEQAGGGSGRFHGG